MNSRAIKLTVSILLMVSLLCCSVTVFADEPDPSPSIPPFDEGTGAVTDELLSRYIWLCLNAWGIQIKYQNMNEFYDEIETQIITWVIEYLASLPSAYTINQWIAPWQADFDYWGNLRLNSSALDDIQDFAIWLKNKLGLTDNDNIVISPIISIDGYQVLEFNKYYTANWTQPEIVLPERQSYIAISYNPNIDDKLIGWMNVYVTDAWNGNPQWWIAIFTESDYNSATGLGCYILNSDTTEIGVSSTNIYGNNMSLGDNYKYGTTIAYYNQNNNGVSWFVTDGNHLSGTLSEINLFLANAEIHQEGNIKVVSGSIVMPYTDPSYVEGDSITIIDGQPDYSVIEWDGTVSVDNLPAIVSTGTIENPEIDQIYTNIPAFFRMAGDTMNAFKQIIFRMPDEVLISIYAVLAVGVIFGFLRIMREH